jgi:hypothetical protein
MESKNKSMTFKIDKQKYNELRKHLAKHTFLTGEVISLQMFFDRAVDLYIKDNEKKLDKMRFKE